MSADWNGTIRVGTRGSPLARVQTQQVVDAIQALYPKASLTVRIFITAGDRSVDSPMHQMGGKGLFVGEIEAALQEGSIDLAVHSMKDLPACLPAGLVLGAVPAREDARDVLVVSESELSGGIDLDPDQVLTSLPEGALLGTSSLRRRAQLLHFRPDLDVRNLRGNLDTRLRRLREGDFFGIVVAAAGLRRLGAECVAIPLPPSVCIPAVGQGALAVETRAEHDELLSLLAPLDDLRSRLCITAERSFLATIAGGCQAPAGAYACYVADDTMMIGAMIASPDGSRLVRGTNTGGPDDAAELGRTLGATILDQGGADILRDLPR